MKALEASQKNSKIFVQVGKLINSVRSHCPLQAL